MTSERNLKLVKAPSISNSYAVEVKLSDMVYYEQHTFGENIALALFHWKKFWWETTKSSGIEKYL